ncbi:hypothetical protein SLA2020_224780 [Shorea laevis]
MNFKAYICPETPQNRTLLPPFLKFFETNKNLTLFYNCTPPAEVPNENKISKCGAGYNNILFYMNDLERDDHHREPYECCTVKVVIYQMAFNNFQERKLRLFDALRDRGFDVEYNSNAVLCDQCENLGGICENNSSSTQYLQTTCQRRPGPGMDYQC